MSNSELHRNKHLEEINKYPTFDREQEKQIAKRIQNGDEAAILELVKANLKFVILVAKKYVKSGLPLLELVNEGTIGLIEAAKRFKHDRGVKFITYAVWWIRQAILYAISNKTRMVRLPPKQENMLHAINKITLSLTQKLGRSPTLTEIAQDLQISPEEIETLYSVSRTLVPLEIPSDENESGNTVIDIPDENTKLAEHQVIEDEFVDDVELLLTCLDDREKEILKLHFGFDGDSLSLQEIGDKFNLTRERIRQIEQKAIAKLRRKAVQQNLQDYLR